jgi:hypothetical protein
MIALRRNTDLAEAYTQAWGREPAWRAAIKGSLSSLDDAFGESFRQDLRVGMRQLELDPQAYDLP